MRRYKWASCLQLETETKARLRPLIAGLGLEVSQPDMAPRAAALAATYADKSWTRHMEELAGFTDGFLVKFRDLADAAPPQERETVASMVVHEIALNDFAKLELAGEGDRSIDDVVALLQWPLPKPASD